MLNFSSRALPLNFQEADGIVDELFFVTDNIVRKGFQELIGLRDHQIGKLFSIILKCLFWFPKKLGQLKWYLSLFFWQ